MASSTMLTGWLLVGGTVLGLAFVAHPALVRIWTMPREQHVAVVAAHPAVWALLNAGFVLATVTTSAAIIVMGTSVYAGSAWSAAITACGVAYSLGGVLWCAELGIRTRTTPLLHELGPSSFEQPPVRILDAVTGGLFSVFVVLCGSSVGVLGLTLLAAGGLPVVVCLLTAAVGFGLVVWLLVAGDVIPAVLYLPTLLVGVALLAGWE